MVLDRKIAFIHLDDNSITVTPLSLDLRKKLLRGRGISMYILSRK
jgi:predicted membrane GTPase involved in stress response